MSSKRPGCCGEEESGDLMRGGGGQWGLEGEEEEEVGFDERGEWGIDGRSLLTRVSWAKFEATAKLSMTWGR